MLRIRQPLLNTSSQVVVLNRVESTAQVFLPTVTQAGSIQTISLNLVVSTAQVYLPTINLVSTNLDTSDILKRGLKRKNVLTPEEEEAIAAQLLKARQKIKKHEKKIKKLVDWKKPFLDKVNGVKTEEELKRIQLEISQEETAVRALELQAALDRQEAAISAKLEEQRRQLEEARILQAKILEQYRIAQEAAAEEERRVAYEAAVAEKAYLELKRKRDNKIKRLKAFMWLTTLDL